MYFGGKNYLVNLAPCMQLKDFMVYKVYNKDPKYIEMIANLIGSKIDCLEIKTDPIICTIDIEIKKTTMRRAKGYNASSMYYYGIMQSVFKEFFDQNPELVNFIKNTTNLDPYANLSNLYHVYCIGDKYVRILLY